MQSLPYSNTKAHDLCKNGKPIRINVRIKFYHICQHYCVSSTNLNQYCGLNANVEDKRKSRGHSEGKEQKQLFDFCYKNKNSNCQDQSNQAGE